MTFFKNTLLVILAIYFLSSCRSVGLKHIDIPEIQQCRMLSRSIYCTDETLDEYKISQIKFYITENQNLDEIQKIELINYFEDNLADILKNKEYEISFEYMPFFRGYFLTNAMDEAKLKVFTLEQLRLLEKYIFLYGRFTDRQLQQIDSRMNKK